ncbi:MAG: 50S ribosomal protein L13 [Bacteroidales bacterium]|nr:50S ribosomal protein L13 [bacterium]MDE5559963.1 50S ribosomal protein L13 [Bacteroidales bacterium]MDE5606153.1 50S ribosomal protein L13 [Bacteroidales bacterium]MDE5736080.1 50S ribosomal protein L13 [Bacteroidales bacterium]MDE6106157.1 50S ribosomal protein L13 [Bacteroidales bacterium]
MNTLSYKTVSVNKENADKKWVLVDAENQFVGRLASEIANLLRGKYKTNFTPHADCGDYVVVINAEKVRFSGKKMTDKEYVHHTGYPGGQRFATPTEMLNRKPIFVIEHAVKGMLPKNRLGDALFRNLHVYEGAEHPHQAQNPTVVNVKDLK